MNEEVIKAEYGMKGPVPEELSVSQMESDKKESEPKKRGRPKKERYVQRKGRQSNPTEEDFKPRDQKASKKWCPTLEELDDMPLLTHEDYKKYNEAVRARRKALREKDVEFLYAPIDVIKCSKVRITRTSNRGKPINLNLRKLKHAVWFQSPKEGYKDGEEVIIPDCLIDEINKLSEPKYKQVKYPDGSSETKFDYWDNKYSVQMVIGDG